MHFLKFSNFLILNLYFHATAPLQHFFMHFFFNITQNICKILNLVPNFYEFLCLIHISTTYINLFTIWSTWRAHILLMTWKIDIKTMSCLNRWLVWALNCNTRSPSLFFHPYFTILLWVWTILLSLFGWNYTQHYTSPAPRNFDPKFYYYVFWIFGNLCSSNSCLCSSILINNAWSLFWSSKKAKKEIFPSLW